MVGAGASAGAASKETVEVAADRGETTAKAGGEDCACAVERELNAAEGAVGTVGTVVGTVGPDRLMKERNSEETGKTAAGGGF